MQQATYPLLGTQRRWAEPSTTLLFIVHRIAMSSNGYATVAKTISQDPDKETYIFRRFDRLTARNLINLQGELLTLEEELDALDAKAASSPDPDLHLSMRSWKAMKANAEDCRTRDGVEEKKRIEIAGELQVKLRQYRKFATKGC